MIVALADAFGSTSRTNSQSGASGESVESSESDGGSNEIDQGLGARDASEDVTISSCAADSLGFVNGKLSITNHSNGRSDYYVEVVFLDAAGTNIGSGNALAMSVEGGQNATTDLFGTFTGKLARCKLTEVQRTASN